MRWGALLAVGAAVAGLAAAFFLLRDGDGDEQGRTAAAPTTAAAPATTATAPEQSPGETQPPPAPVAHPGEPPGADGVGPGRMLVGFQDDPSFRWQPDRQAMLDAAAAAGTTVIRATVNWHQAAATRPGRTDDPFDPAYRLEDIDELARNAQRRGIELLLTIWGTPSWANGGESPNHPPLDPDDLRSFAHALADRYSGRHAGYPFVRLYSIWNEPNLEQFLAPQFDARGRSVSPWSYARMARAAYAGIKAGNPEALVALGETSARGRDRPSPNAVQDSHSPARFARLVAELRPPVQLDAWAHHPYPTSPDQKPDQRVRWPNVNLTRLQQFGTWLDRNFGRTDLPLWLTEYGHETLPEERLGVTRATQAAYTVQALELARAVPRVKMFVWFVFRDDPGGAWESGLLGSDGRAKPALEPFTAAARPLDARNLVVPAGESLAQVPVRELAYFVPAGSRIRVDVGGRRLTARLGLDGTVPVPLDGLPRPGTVVLTASDAKGHAVERVLELR